MNPLLASGDVDTAALVFGLAGGLAIFLFGMQQMSEALRIAAGEGMKTLLAKLTRNRFLAALTGAIVTAVIQSSSVTTVLVVGFVTAKIMTLSQAVGVIMGSNVGTTITAQIVAFNITQYAMLMVAVGFLMMSVAKRSMVRQYGAMLMGLGLIFVGMDQMSQATYPLRTYQPFIDLMQRMDNPLLGVLVGAAFTALVQSSSATTGIVIMLASQGVLSLEAGIALALGANIGTCFTAVLAAIGKPAEAVQAAAVHVIFNVIGALVWIPLIPLLSQWATAMSPTYENLEGLELLAAQTPRQVANANTIFNVANTAVLIWFTGPIARLAQWIAPARPEEEKEIAEPKYLDDVYLGTPALALDRVRKELGHLGEYVVDMVEQAPEAVTQGTREDLQRVEDMDENVDRLHEAIVGYLQSLASAEMSKKEARLMKKWLDAANYLENTGDLIETNLVAQGRQRLERDLTISDATLKAMTPLYVAVANAMTDAIRALRDDDKALAQRVIDRHDDVQKLSDETVQHLTARLASSDPNRVVAFRIESDIVTEVEWLYFFAKRIARLVV